MWLAISSIIVIVCFLLLGGVGLIISIIAGMITYFVFLKPKSSTKIKVNLPQYKPNGLPTSMRRRTTTIKK
jgi:hypothetical protein